MTTKDGKPIRNRCISLRKGTITLFNNIHKTLQERIILLSDDLIAEAIKGRSEHREKEWFLSVAASHVQVYIKDLLNDLREHGLDLNLPIAFAGGGAELLEEQLTSSDANVVAIFDRFANADGYKALLTA